MTYRIILRKEALEEALEAADYIAEHGSPEIAVAWYEGLEGAITSLGEFPHRCHYARENECFPGVELRQRLFNSHRLIYAVRGEEVHILHIRHVHQDSLDEL